MPIPNDLRPVAPPEDLAGYQHVITGAIQPGDILVEKITRRKSWANDWFIDVDALANDHLFDIYRKMECPKHEGQTKSFFDVDVHEIDLRRVINERAKTNDEGKPPLANLPWKALREVAGVQAFGHAKYGDFHNYKLGMEISRQLSCAIRHIADFMDGIDLDSESGRNHLAHAACRILFTLETFIEKTAKDDRYKANEATHSNNTK